MGILRPMYIDIVPNRGSPPAILLRESIRDGKRVRKRTIANLSALPIAQAAMIRRVLKGEKLGPLESALDVVRSRAHGHVEAVLTAMRRLGLDKLVDARPSHERDLVAAMVAGRIIAPEASKLGMTRAWADTTLPDEFGVADADEDCLYAAMDWLIERQEAIEQRLARRHLKAGGLVLFDLTSSYFEGVTCPLAKLGYSRDSKPGTLQVNWGLLTDERGCPVAVSVFEGNTGDPKTLLPQVEKVRASFGIDRLVMAGGRGMISSVQIDAMGSMLAYYVQWHMIEAWAPLTFTDEADADAARARDPVAPARRSDAALAKAHTRQLADGTPAMSFTRLLAHMATIVRNTMRSASARIGEATFTLTTPPNPKQQQALDLLTTIAV
jgi:hypothetical protein